MTHTYYQPEEPPLSVEEIPTYLSRELRRIAEAISSAQSADSDKQHNVPNKLLDGMIRYADGTNWNPGSGAGVYLYNGTAWERFTPQSQHDSLQTAYTNLQAEVDALQADYILIREEQASGTQGGTFNSGAWQTRTLNTEVSDVGGHATLASNQITLAAGTYLFMISCPAHNVDGHKAQLYNVTDTSVILIGQNTNSTLNTVTSATVSGKFVLSASKTLEVRHRCQTSQTTTGFGIQHGFGVIEVYTVAEFWKVS